MIQDELHNFTALDVVDQNEDESKVYVKTHSCPEQPFCLQNVSSEPQPHQALVGVYLEYLPVLRHLGMPKYVVLHEYKNTSASGTLFQLRISSQLSNWHSSASE